MAKRNEHGGHRSSRSTRARPRSGTPSAESQDEAFRDLRSGAANIAGVAFQVATSALLLVSGRAEVLAIPRVIAVRPEGFEDVDCRLEDGRWMLVQCKQRSKGRRPIGLGDLAEMLVHASRAMRARDYDSSIALLVVATDGIFIEDLPATGWHASLVDVCSPEVVSRLVADIDTRLGRTNLAGNGVTGAALVELARTVTLDQALFARVESGVADAYSVHPAVAAMARAELFSDIATLSAAQRGSSVGKALTRSVQDLDTLIETLSRATDTKVLSEAVTAGVCEFANFIVGSPDAAGEFFAGVKVAPGHVAAGLDVARETEMGALGRAVDRGRYVVVVGPSGAGKSALMWRTAASRTSGELIIRVLRVATDADVTHLVEYVRQMRPNSRRAVLLCVDDLGRDSTAKWPAARDRLLEIPYVKILAACRQEDLTPAISLGAALVSAVLDTASAQSIYERMESSGYSMATEPEEAIDRANGLLMEFIAIATTGKRLRDVLAAQVTTMDAVLGGTPARVLRVVLALHSLGYPVPAHQLGRAVGADEADIGLSMRRLRDEHLLVGQEDDAWSAIHDLRAEVLLEILHESPPPTMASTYASSIKLANPDVRPALYRRALARLARRFNGSRAEDPERHIVAITDSLEPMVSAIREDLELAALAGRPELVARLIEVADRIDVFAYLGATRTAIRELAPSSADPDMIYLVAYAARFTAVLDGSDALAGVAAFGRSLPEWSERGRREVLTALNPTRLAELLLASPIEVAVQLCEAVEGAVGLTIEQARTVFKHHRPHVPISQSLHEAGLLAQLIASLYVLASVEPQQASQIFGDVVERAEWAAGSDDCVFRIQVRADAPIQELPSGGSTLARARTFGDLTFMEIRVGAFYRTPNDGPATHAYAAINNGDPGSSNAQACFLAQRLLDACPEADLARIRLVSAAAGVSSEATVPDGRKDLRQGVLVRRADQRRTMAIQAALIELSSTELWSERCRRQAEVGRRLASLLQEIPSRLNPWDNQRRRADWLDQLQSLSTVIADLPGLPVERSATNIGREASERSGELDRQLREMVKDRSRRVLGDVVDALLQFGRNASSSSAQGGSAMRLADARKALVEARENDLLPVYAGVGETLPLDLDSGLLLASRAISAFASGDLPRRRFSAEELAQRIEQDSRSRAEEECDALTALLRAAGLEVAATAVIEEPSPIVPSIYHLVVVGIAAEDWNELERVLDAVDQESVAHVPHLLVPVAGTRVLAFGLRTLPPRRKPTIVLEDRVELAASALAKDMVPTHWQTVVGTILARMVSEHATRVRQTRRPDRWPPEQRPAIPEWRSMLELAGPPSWEIAREALKELDARIANSEGSIESFVQAASGGDAFPSFDLQSSDQLLPTAAVAYSIMADLESLAEVSTHPAVGQADSKEVP